MVRDSSLSFGMTTQFVVSMGKGGVKTGDTAARFNSTLPGKIRRPVIPTRGRNRLLVIINIIMIPHHRSE